MAFDQSNKLLQLSGAPFGGNEVFLTSLSGTESISRLFTFQIEFFSTKLNLTASDVVGKNVNIKVERVDDSGSVIGSRFFNGFVNRLSAGTISTEDSMTYRGYRAEVVPWFWFLTQTARCHIFFPEKEEKSIFEIIESVFKRTESEFHVTPEWEASLASDLKSRMVKHCVQYRETDFNFVSRLLEQFGAFYFFKHEDGKHTLVISSKSNYSKCDESSVEFPGKTGAITDNCIDSWEHSYEFVSGKWTQTDYDFESPLTNLQTDSPKISAATAPDVPKYEVYDFPGEYIEKSDGASESRLRQEEQEIPHNVVHASSSCKSFSAGHKFKLNSHPDKEIEANEKGEYLITSIQHQASQTYQGHGVTSYSNGFSCIPASMPFRPARITPKPIVSGIQTGVVTGPSGEEIYTDKYGRVKVFFHWDRETRKIKNTQGENCSCWVRVAQQMAGRKWGFMAVPRIGQEVVLEFLEGDPDRPLIIGSVYNADQMPHYDPVAHKTRISWKSNSSKGGDGFNEMFFEDKADDERVFMHAQKNMDTRVLNDSKERIYGNRHQIIGWEKDGKKGGDQREMVWQDKHLNIKRNQIEHIEGKMQLKIGGGDADDGGYLDTFVEKRMVETIGEDGYDFHLKGDRKELIDKTASLAIGGDQMVEITGDDHLKVGGNRNQEIGGSHSLDITDDYIEIAGKKHIVDAGQEVHIKGGMKVIIEAGMQVSLVGAGGFVDVGPAGVTIQGVMVKINSGGAAGSGSGGSAESPIPPIKPEDAEEAEPVVPSQAHNEKTGQKSVPQ